MTPQIFLRLNDRLELGADARQWILLRSSRNKATGEENWAPISFVSSTKDILRRCIEESGLDDGTAVAAAERLPATFKAWKAAKKSSQRSLEAALEG